MTHRGCEVNFTLFLWKFCKLATFLIALLSDSGVKKSLGEKTRDFAFPFTLKRLNELKNACEGTV